MKRIKIIVLFFLFTPFLYSQDSLNEQINIKLDEIKKSDPKIRYKKMNELKVLLRKVNSENRIKIINKIKSNAVSKNRIQTKGNSPRTDVKSSFNQKIKNKPTQKQQPKR